jgi:capsular exopolysaccharide synthesis family protein
MVRVRDDSPLAIIWRRRVLIGATFLVFVVAAAVVSKSLEKVYSTHSTLLVALEAAEQSFDSVQASQAVARSFADIIDSPNIAGEVAVALGDGSSARAARELGYATNFEAVSETQLLEVHAEDPDPARAKRIADTYAIVFIDYARRNLAETTKAMISLADPAPLPRSPTRPKPTLYTLIAAFLGLALGLALGFLRDRLDHRLRTSQDVELRFEAPVLARVPRRRRSKKSISAFLESYRVLRASLQFSTVGSPARSIAVTSGEAGEGKTTTVMQLAMASAEMGLKVIVVEADFRRPWLQRAFMPGRVESLLPGFSNYLVGEASVEEVIHPTGLPNISIVPAGPLPPTPSTLLESRFGNRATADLLSPADLILIDCPPLSAGADASLIATWVDGLIVVVDLGSSTVTTVRGALKSLEATHARVLGLVLNRDPSLEKGSYGYDLEGETERRQSRGREREPV